MDIDLDKCKACLTTHDFNENDKCDPITSMIEERFGQILKKIYIVDGSIVVLYRGINET